MGEALNLAYSNFNSPKFRKGYIDYFKIGKIRDAVHASKGRASPSGARVEHILVFVENSMNSSFIC